MTAASYRSGRRGLSHDVTIMLVARALIFVLALGVASLRGHGLGAALYGMFAIALFLPTLMAAVLNLGISVSNVYHIGRGEIHLRQALRVSLCLALGLSTVGLAAGAVLIGSLGHVLFPNVPATLLWIALVHFPLLLLRSIFIGLFQAVEDFRSYNRLLLLEFVGTLVLTLLAFLTLDATAEWAMLAFSSATLITLFAACVMLRRQLPPSDRPAVPGYAGKCLRFGWKANLANVLAYLNYRLDIFLVNLFIGPAATGIYAAAVVFIERLWALPQAVSTVTLPRLASLHESPARASGMTEQSGRIVLLVTLALGAAVAAVGHAVLPLLYGPEFRAGALALLLLIPGCVVASWAKILTNSLAAAGHVGLNACSAAVLVLVNLVANLLLIPRFGIAGAAIASTLGWFVYALITATFYARLFGRPWWAAAWPQRSDWQWLAPLAPVRGGLSQVIRLGPFRHVRHLFKTRTRGKRLAQVCGSVLVGLLVTGYIEDAQTQRVRPLRNLIVLGSTQSRSASPFGPTKYAHSSGVNPVHVAQTVRTTALQVLDTVPSGGTAEHSDAQAQLLVVADYFRDSGQRRIVDGVPFRVWSYHFDYPYYRLKKPWCSGMAQGHVIELMVAAYRLTGRESYRETAIEAAQALTVPIAQGGVAVKQGGGIWFEEYACTASPPPMVLNGHNFALNGLWHLGLIEPRFRDVFDQGIVGLKARLKQFDKGIWSHYDLLGTPANQKYQRIHHRQLQELYARTGDPVLNEYAQRFGNQLIMPLHVGYRLAVQPRRLLVGLVCVNSAAVFLVLNAAGNLFWVDGDPSLPPR